MQTMEYRFPADSTVYFIQKGKICKDTVYAIRMAIGPIRITPNAPYAKVEYALKDLNLSRSDDKLEWINENKLFVSIEELIADLNNQSPARPEAV